LGEKIRREGEKRIWRERKKKNQKKKGTVVGRMFLLV